MKVLLPHTAAAALLLLVTTAQGRSIGFPTINEDFTSESSQFAPRDVDDRVTWIKITLGGVGIIGYTLKGGAEAVGNFTDSCFEYQGPNVATKGDCARDAAYVMAAYAAAGVSGYHADTALVALATGTQLLANTLNGNQGQGPNTRSTVNIDSIGLYQQPQWRAATPEELARANTSSAGLYVDQQRCSENNNELNTPDHHFNIIGGSGLKLQCKNGCGYTGFSEGADRQLLNMLATKLTTQRDGAVSQFTVYDEHSDAVIARCKAVFETVPTDTCPEAIDGQGCNA